MRNWFLTENEETDDKVAYLKRLNAIKQAATYAIICEEQAPTTGHKHFHLFAQFDKDVNFKEIKDVYNKAHIEIARNNEACSKYCKKEDKDFIEIGELRLKN